MAGRSQSKVCTQLIGSQEEGSTLQNLLRSIVVALGLLQFAITARPAEPPDPPPPGYALLYRGGICVADSSGNCIGGDAVAEARIGQAIGYMKTSPDPGTVPVYRGTCYSDVSGDCVAWGLTLEVNGTPIGYLSTSAPDPQSESAPFTQSGGLLLQNLGGTASAYLWFTVLPPPSILTRGNENDGTYNQTATFHFNQGLPQNVTSVRFYLVYKGPLGEESESVIVGEVDHVGLC